MTVPLLLVSESVLADSITALGFPVCFYYGFTGLACPWYFRHELFKSARNFFLVGLAPLLGGLMLFGVFIKAVDLLRRKRKRRIGADRGHHAAAVVRHRRHGPRR